MIMTSPEFSAENPRQYAREILNQSSRVISEAVAIVSPDNPGVSPLDIFPAPKERRSDDEGIELTEDQELRLRTCAAELGFGRQSNRSMSELGLYGGHVIIEGGYAHKMLAEALLVVEDQSADPASIVISVTPNRQIDDAEREITARVLGIEVANVGKTEYEVARQVANTIPGFEKAEFETELPYRYDIDDEFKVFGGSNGQFTSIGRVGHAPVILLRVDREDYIDEGGDHQYRNQPDAAALIKIVDSILRNNGDTIYPIAFVTSGTYQPSREVDGARAALSVNRKVGIPTYGTELLALVKGESIPAPGPVNQLPGEFHKMVLQVQRLQEVIEKS